MILTFLSNGKGKSVRNYFIIHKKQRINMQNKKKHK